MAPERLGDYDTRADPRQTVKRKSEKARSVKFEVRKASWGGGLRRAGLLAADLKVRPTAAQRTAFVRFSICAFPPTCDSHFSLLPSCDFRFPFYYFPLTDPSPSRADARRAFILGAGLLLVDVVFILLDVLLHKGVLHDQRFAITRERGFGEWLQYAKMLGLVVMLLSVCRTNTAASVWAGLFAYLLVDDAFEVHERVGAAIAPLMALPQVGSVRPGQLAELLVFGVVGVAFVMALAVVLRRGHPNARGLSMTLAIPFALLAFFGSAMDLAHSMLRGHGFYYTGGLVEDGGEMVSMSVLAAVTFWATWRWELSCQRQIVKRRTKIARS